MERIINIDGKDVKFKATAATLRLYRMKFRRDLMVDLMKISEKAGKKNKNLDVIDLELFENAAYIMAKQADNSVPDTPEEWLDGFDTFAIRDILPGIMELWSDNMETMSDSKKKMIQLTEK